MVEASLVQPLAQRLDHGDVFVTQGARSRTRYERPLGLHAACPGAGS